MAEGRLKGRKQLGRCIVLAPLVNANQVPEVIPAIFALSIAPHGEPSSPVLPVP